MESLSNATNTSSSALERARDQQRITDDLLAAVNESRRLADDAISNAERILVEAEQTLNTLRGESGQCFGAFPVINADTLSANFCCL